MIFIYKIQNTTSPGKTVLILLLKIIQVNYLTSQLITALPGGRLLKKDMKKLESWILKSEF